MEEHADGFRGTADVVPNMWVPGTSSLRSSVLVTWADILLGYVAARSLAPAIPVTLELDLHLFEDVTGRGTVHASGRLVKAGRSVTASAVEFTDGGGRPVAIGHVLSMAASVPGATARGGRWALDTFSARQVLPEPFPQRAGCERLAPGVASLPCADHVLN
ncbi:MAG: hotdog domain-containing protein, partial [Candidatus Binatia bacterium]